ncbi:MAG TPA: FTR1 family protein [Bacillales bacterium]|nr:FTR1 family protein [Bacillales bacterium]
MRLFLKLGIIGLFLMVYVSPAHAADADGLAELAEKAEHHADEHEFQAVKQDLEAFHEQWEEVEADIKEDSAEAYEAIESAYVQAVAAVNVDQPDAEQVEEAVAALEAAVTSYTNGGNAAEGDRPGAAVLLGLTHELDEVAEYAESGKWDEAVEEYEAFHEGWETVEADIRAADHEAYEQIETKMSLLKAGLYGDSRDGEQVETAVHELKEAINAYADEGTKARPGAQALLSLTHELDEVGEYAEAGNWDEARAEYEAFHEGWEGVEDGIREADHEAYEEIETNMSLLAAQLNSENPSAEKVEQAAEALIASIEEYAEGAETESAPEGDQSIATLVQLLNRVETAIENKNAAEAREYMTKFIQVWPTIEGQVQARSAEAYTDTETRMTKALGLLASDPAQFEKAESVVSAMKSQLAPLAEQTSYSFWDAAIILLREGLEIILILAALLSFLKKTNNADKRKWIWGGAGAGVLVSVGLAFGLTSILTAAVAGKERELLEGITGLAAVVVMFTVGSWLHNKSNIVSWNKFINEKVGTALARGSLWSLAFVSFLTVVREGAETIIFYLGIVSDISTTQLLTGMATAVLILFVFGFAIIKFSVKLPIGGLFLGITVLIYYLALKFTGESIHALQVVDQVPADSIAGFPTIDWLGVYPTWQTLLAQIVLLVLIAVQTIWSAKRKKAMREQAMMESKRQSREAVQSQS